MKEASFSAAKLPTLTLLPLSANSFFLPLLFFSFFLPLPLLLHPSPSSSVLFPIILPLLFYFDAPCSSCLPIIFFLHLFLSVSFPRFVPPLIFVFSSPSPRPHLLFLLLCRLSHSSQPSVSYSAFSVVLLTEFES